MAGNKNPNMALLGRPIGVGGLVEYAGYVFDEWLPELQGPKGRRILREMADNDALIGAILFSIDQLIRQVVWNVVPGESGDEAPATFLEQCLNDMSVSFGDSISEILSFLPYGFSLHELCYKLRDGTASRYSDNKIGWASWPMRGQETLQRWEFHPDTFEVMGMHQLGPPDWKWHFIPLEKAMLFRTTTKRGNPEGRSILRNAYRSWYFKRHIEEIEAIGIERDLAGLPIAWVPPELLDENASDEDKALFATFKQIATRVKRDEEEGLVFPLAYDEKGNKIYDFQLLSTGGQRAFNTDAVIGRYDQRILMTAMADMIILGHERVGSNALAQSKSKLFTAALQAWLQVIEDVINTQAIPKLLALNGMETQDPPRLEHGDIERADLDSLGALMLNLASAGFLLDTRPDGPLLAHIMEEARLPAPPPPEDLDLLDDNLADVENAPIDEERAGAPAPENAPPAQTSKTAQQQTTGRQRQQAGARSRVTSGKTKNQSKAVPSAVKVKKRV